MIRAGALTGYTNVMHGLSQAPEPLLARFGIKKATLSDVDALLPIEDVCALLEESSQKTDCSDLGLRIARYQGLDALGVLGLAIQAARTPAEATGIVTRYIFLQSTALEIRVEGPDGFVPNTMTSSVQIVGIPLSRQRQAIELLLGIGHQISLQRAPWSSPVRAVSLPHAIIGSSEPHKKFFGVPIHENRPTAALHLDATGWHIPTGTRKKTIVRMAKGHVPIDFPAPRQRMSNRVSATLRPLIGTPQANREDIARLLAIEPRTLHRRLRAEGTSFQSIKDEMRRELAFKYLSETDITLGQLTLMLGFPEQSALSRACRKWFGVSPTALRKVHREG